MAMMVMAMRGSEHRLCSCIYVRVGASPSGRGLVFGSEPCLRGGGEVGGCGAVRAVWWCCGGGANLKCRVVNHCLAHCSSPIATSGCWPPRFLEQLDARRGNAFRRSVAQVALWISPRVAWHEKILLLGHCFRIPKLALSRALLTRQQVGLPHGPA